MEGCGCGVEVFDRGLKWEVRAGGGGGGLEEMDDSEGGGTGYVGLGRYVSS